MSEVYNSQRQSIQSVSCFADYGMFIRACTLLSILISCTFILFFSILQRNQPSPFRLGKESMLSLPSLLPSKTASWHPGKVPPTLSSPLPAFLLLLLLDPLHRSHRLRLFHIHCRLSETLTPNKVFVWSDDSSLWEDPLDPSACLHCAKLQISVFHETSRSRFLSCRGISQCKIKQIDSKSLLCCWGRSSKIHPFIRLSLYYYKHKNGHSWYSC